MRQATLSIALLLTVTSLCVAKTPTTLGRVEKLDPAFDAIVDSNAKIEVLASGFTWTEGPVWVADDSGGHLLFSDIPRNSIFRWSEKRGTDLFMSPSGYTGASYYGLEPGSNGLTLDPQGRLTACEHGDRRVSVLTKGGGKRTLVDNYQGKRLNSPNDLVFHSSGSIFFTDPPYGLPDRESDPRRELDFCGVYRLDTDGSLTLVSKELARPNGIGLSPDEKTLYVAQSDPEIPSGWRSPSNRTRRLKKAKSCSMARSTCRNSPDFPMASPWQRTAPFSEAVQEESMSSASRQTARATDHRWTHKQLHLWSRWQNAVHHRRQFSLSSQAEVDDCHTTGRAD